VCLEGGGGVRGWDGGGGSPQLHVTSNTSHSILRFAFILITLLHTSRYGVSPLGVVNGTSAVYIPALPMHQKRLSKPMQKLLKPEKGEKYCDLIVTFRNDASGGDVKGPPIRYFFKGSK
jgi:hypothetical protein